MDPLLLQLVRLAKMLAAFSFVASAVVAVLPGELERRRGVAYRVVGPSLGATWVFGILLTWLTGRSLLSLFVVGGFFLSLLPLHAVLYAVGREGRQGPGGVVWVTVSSALIIALMVFKP